LEPRPPSFQPTTYYIRRRECPKRHYVRSSTTGDNDASQQTRACGACDCFWKGRVELEGMIPRAGSAARGQPLSRRSAEGKNMKGGTGRIGGRNKGRKEHGRPRGTDTASATQLVHQRLADLLRYFSFLFFSFFFFFLRFFCLSCTASEIRDRKETKRILGGTRRGDTLVVHSTGIALHRANGVMGLWDMGSV
jgi:hypothetical protein